MIDLSATTAGCEEPAQDVENDGLLAQVGYTVPSELGWLSGVTPYLGYESWDRWSNAPSGD